MKVLFITNTLNTRSTGMARMMHFLRDESLNSDWHLDLVFAEDVPCGFTSRRWKQLCFPYFLFFTFLRLHRKEKYDAVMIHTTEGAFYTFLRKFFKGLPPCVIVSFGADEMRWELENEEERLGYIRRNFSAYLFYYPLVVLASRFAVMHADHVLVGARTEIDFFEKRYGMDRRRITFVPNGVSKDYFIPRNYGYPANKLLYVGGWEWRKGIRYLIESFSQIAAKFPDVTLTLSGMSESDGDIRLCFPEKIRHQIKIILIITPQIYAEHDIFVFPTLFESISLVLPEAMASGMPVITTRTCGMQDIVEDGVTGFLVPPRNVELLTQRIGELLKNPPLCEKLGKAARQKAVEIRWDEVFLQVKEVCKKSLAGD